MSGSTTFRERTARRLGIALTLWAAWAGPAAAQRPSGEYVRDQWGSDRGFPGGPVHAITQTTDGYLWIAADKGLVRFDGLSFRLVTPSQAASSVGPTVLGVAAAADGSLWARMRGPALLRYRRGEFENMLPGAGMPEAVVSAMVRGPDDALVLATVGEGALTYRNDRFERIAPPDRMPSSSFVISIAAPGGGEYWLGTRGAGLVRAQGAVLTRFVEGLPDLKINCLLSSGGELWIGTDKGMARWNGTAITQSEVAPALRALPALAMVRDRAGTTWIAAGPGGLVRVDPDGTVSSTPHDTGGASRHVSAVFEDRDGNVWVGSETGIERWRRPIFTTYSTADGLPPGGIGPIFVDAAGRTWFAPAGGGLHWMQQGVVHRVDVDGLDRDVIYSIDGDAGEVWVGRQRGGLTRLRWAGAALSATTFTPADGLARDSVYAVARTREGSIWAGTLNGGVSRYQDGTFTRYDAASGLASNAVSAIAASADGTVWVATPGGLSAWSRGTWRTLTKAEGLPSSDVTALLPDRDGHLWVGTANGLARIDAGVVRQPDGMPAALSGSIRGLAADATGRLWVTTPDRIVSVDREALTRGAWLDADLREYGAADGLLVVEAVRRHRTIVADAHGRIWVALNRGVAVTDPGRTGPSRPALTRVETLSADGAPVDVAAPIAIPSSRRRVVFGFAGLSLSVPERVRYRYRLDGFDADWSEAAPDRQAAYTNLAPGQYRFRVIASNSDGLWNGEEAALALTIRPMLWETGWFRAAAVGVAILLGWALYRLRLRQVARQISVRFEERLDERTRIAQELHDTLLQGFVSASMQLHVAFDRLPDDSPARPPVARVLDLMGRVIDEGRNAVRGLRSTAAVGHDLEQALSGVPQELAVGPHPAFRVVVQGTPRPVAPAIRDEVYRIGREALVNAFRHAGAATVEVELEYGPRELRLFVRDDGRGMEGEVARAGIDGHWGITGMRERAERIGATLKLRSRAAAGTEVELRVPGQAAFGRASQGGGWLAWFRGADATTAAREKRP